MNREFKFRHANEIAGVFVITAVALFVVGIIFAGKSQGWFEPRFTLHMLFETTEGSFGLQEGALVMVRNTAAGRVGPILPTPDGLMGTTLVLKDRFRPFITTDSVAKIKKKFGVAGDSYVDIERGQGAVIADGAYLECKKDEEILETAQRMLTEMQASLLPIFEQVETIIANAASIMAKVERGEGLAGAAIGDSALRDDVKALVVHLEGVAAHAEMATGQVGELLNHEITRLVTNVETLSIQAAGLMSNEVPQLAAGTVKVQDEVSQTLAESRRLITALQRHWLFRKYVETEPERLPLVPTALSWPANAAQGLTRQAALAAARAADDTEAVAREAYNLAVYALGTEAPAQAAALLAESALASRSLGRQPPELLLLEAELLRRAGDTAKAAARGQTALDALRGRDSRLQQVEARILLATVYADAGDSVQARTELKAAHRTGKREDLPGVLSAALAGLEARIAFMEGKLQGAAEAHTEQARHLREAGALPEMAAALRRAGDLYGNLDQSATAADYYLRAAASLHAQDQAGPATQALALARGQAEITGDTLLLARIQALERELTQE